MPNSAASADSPVPVTGYRHRDIPPQESTILLPGFVKSPFLSFTGNHPDLFFDPCSPAGRRPDRGGVRHKKQFFVPGKMDIHE